MTEARRQSPGGPHRGLCWVGAPDPPLGSPVALGPSASAVSSLRPGAGGGAVFETPHIEPGTWISFLSSLLKEQCLRSN